MPTFAKIVNGTVAQVLHVPAAEAATETAGLAWLVAQGKDGTWVMDTANGASGSRGKEPAVGDTWNGTVFAAVDAGAAKDAEQDATIANIITATGQALGNINTQLAALDGRVDALEA